MIIENGVLVKVTQDELKGDFVIPDGVTSIEKGALSGCDNLTGISIPSSVTSIGEYAFYGCSGLTSVTIPDSVTSIGYRAFYGCSGLTSVTIGNSVTSIGNYAFSGCSGLTSVTIPDNVTSIGNCAFRGCDALKSISVGNAVKILGRKHFPIVKVLKLKLLITKRLKLPLLENLNVEKNLCRGKKSFAKGELKLCYNGIHYCTNLFEIFNYYAGEIDKDIAIYKCDVSDENIGEDGTSKRCARGIVPRKRLYKQDVIRILNGGE